MKKLISFVLVLVILLSLSTVAFAVTTKSPTVEAVLVPPIMTAYFRVCDSDGNLVRYLSRDEITCEQIDDIRDYSKIPNLLYVFQFSSTYELKEGEYIEFPIYFNAIENLELKAYANEVENELVIEKILDTFWMLNITEYGIIVITAELPEK